MEKRELFKNFSIRELLITIFKSTLITTFIGFTILFILAVPIMRYSEKLLELNKEEAIELFGTNYGQYDALEQLVADKKLKYGDDYPADLVITSLFQRTKIIAVMETYPFMVMSGIIIGCIVYVVGVQKAKGIELFFEIFMSFIVITIIGLVTNLIFGDVLIYNEYLYYFDVDNHGVFQMYIIIFLLVYICNMIKQKCIANKLNKELNNVKKQVEN